MVPSGQGTNLQATKTVLGNVFPEETKSHCHGHDESKATHINYPITMFTKTRATLRPIFVVYARIPPYIAIHSHPANEYLMRIVI